MSLVGEFPGLHGRNRLTIKGPVNPLDKSTIVSIFPKEIHETKVTLSPGEFYLGPGTYDKPYLLVVGPSSWWREIDHEQPLLEIPVSSIQIAHSVVIDYCNGMLGSNMSDIMPGLFYVPGEHDHESLVKNYKSQLDGAVAKQKRFWELLVKLGDSLWARSSGNPLAVTDDMRLAARELSLTNKDWMKDFTMISMVRCFACGALKNPEYPVCASCRAIDNSHARAKDIKFAS